MKILCTITILLLTLIFCNSQNETSTDMPEEYSLSSTSSDITTLNSNDTEPNSNMTGLPEESSTSATSPDTNLNISMVPTETLETSPITDTTSTTSTTTIESASPPPPKETNLGLILSLSLGLGIPVLLGTIAGIAYFCHKRGASKYNIMTRTTF